MPVLRDVRIVGVSDWSWSTNACRLRFQTGDDDDDDDDAAQEAAVSQWYTSALPPVAAPFVRYAVEVDDVTSSVTRWNVEPPKLDQDTQKAVRRVLARAVVEHLPTLWVLRAALKVKNTPAPLGGSVLDALVHAAQRSDVQVVRHLGDLAGIFDGLNLSTRRLRAVLDNFASFGRHEERCFKKSHSVVFPGPQDPPEYQSADFSRCSDASIRSLNILRPQWMKCRAASAFGLRVTPELVRLSFGDDVLHIFQQHDLFTKLVSSPLQAGTMVESPPHIPLPQVVTAVLQGQNSITWFSPEGQPGTVSVLAGGCDQFDDRSLEHVGFYCHHCDARTWSTSHILKVSLKRKHGGKLYTNATSFFKLVEALRNVT
jgi:hypothetical protein